MKRLLGLAGLLLALSSSARAGDYLYVWGMETRDPSKPMPAPETMGRDFLAVFDVRSSSRDFGNLIAMLPVGAKAQMAHHTNYEMPADGRLFASDYMAGEGYVFDLKEPGHPKLIADFSAVGAYNHAHSFDRLPNGNTRRLTNSRGNPTSLPGRWSSSIRPDSSCAPAMPPMRPTPSFARIASSLCRRWIGW